MCQFYGYIAWFVSESSFENLLGFVTTSYQNKDNPAMMKIENTSKTLINQYNALWMLENDILFCTSNIRCSMKF